MIRKFALFLVAAVTLAACTATPTEAPIGADGKPLPRLYRISKAQESRVQFRMLDAVNALRQAEGRQPIELNASLNAAAATHSRDMAVQNRPWHFGSDGSSPIERVRRAGYDLTMLGENISETFETELQTLSAWMETPDTRGVILDPRAKHMGFSWFQESGGKIWWTMVVGGGGEARIPEPAPAADLTQISNVIPPEVDAEQ